MTNSARSSAASAAGESPARPSSPMPMIVSQGAVAAPCSTQARNSGKRSACASSFWAARRKPPRSRRGWPAGPTSDPLLSMAGRTSDPRPLPIPTRIGGFGGVAGLAGFLARRADRGGDRRHASLRGRDVPQRGRGLRAGRRAAARPAPPGLEAAGRAIAGSRSASMDEAVQALGEAPRRVFLTVGRLELASFAAAPQHTYLVRTIEPIGDALPVPNVIAIQDRAPFDEAAERRLMERERHRDGGDARIPAVRRPIRRSRRRALSACRSSSWRGRRSPAASTRSQAPRRRSTGWSAVTAAPRKSAACRRKALRPRAARSAASSLAPIITMVDMSAMDASRLGERQDP